MMAIEGLQMAEPQCGDVHGTWAYRTIAVRFGRTASRILEENTYSRIIEGRINALIAEIPDTPIRQIDDPGAVDIGAWNHFTQPYIGQKWHKPPWWFTEHYFYRRILEATRYFQAGDGGGVDPFSYQKRRGLEVSIKSIRQLNGLAVEYLIDRMDLSEAVKHLLTFDLWGNQADLSLWPAEEIEKPDHLDPSNASSQILVNNSTHVAQYLTQDKPHQRVDFLIDNAGFELVGDLVLSDFMLQSSITRQILLHVKPHPTYVSDATEADVYATIAYLRSDAGTQTSSLGERLQEAVDNNSLRICTNWFWTSPLAGWQMPDELRDELGQTKLVISKGDAHYRRLLGDRHWPYGSSFDQIMAYYPAPIVALRTLKSEIVVGLQAGQALEVSQQDPEWMVNGRWGMIQFKR